MSFCFVRTHRPPGGLVRTHVAVGTWGLCWRSLELPYCLASIALACAASMTAEAMELTWGRCAIRSGTRILHSATCTQRLGERLVQTCLETFLFGKLQHQLRNGRPRNQAWCKKTAREGVTRVQDWCESFQVSSPPSPLIVVRYVVRLLQRLVRRPNLFGRHCNYQHLFVYTRRVRRSALNVNPLGADGSSSSNDAEDAN